MRTLILLIAFTLSCSVGLAQTRRSASNERRGVEGKGANGNLPPGIKVKPCTQARVHAYFNELVTRLPPTVVTQSRQIAQSPRTRSLARLSTLDSGWLSKFRQEVKTEVQSLNGDKGNLDIEALVYLVMMTVTEDMENDLKEIMKDVKKSNEEKAALRGKISKLREDTCHFIDQRERAVNEGGRPL